VGYAGAECKSVVCPGPRRSVCTAGQAGFVKVSSVGAHRRFAGRCDDRRDDGLAVCLAARRAQVSDRCTLQSIGRYRGWEEVIAGLLLGIAVVGYDELNQMFAVARVGAWGEVMGCECDGDSDCDYAHWIACDKEIAEGSLAGIVHMRPKIAVPT